MVATPTVPAPSLNTWEQDVAKRPTLRQVRARKLWSIARLAQESGVAPSTILDIEKRSARPRFATIERLAEALGVAPDAIDWPGNPLELDPDEEE